MYGVLSPEPVKRATAYSPEWSVAELWVEMGDSI
jgi:hypothetical protein